MTYLPDTILKQRLALLFAGALQPTPVAAPDPAMRRILEGFRPTYYTEVGAVTATLHKVSLSKTGQTVAFYDVRYRDTTGRRISIRYLYGVRGNAPYEIKRLSHQVTS